MFNRFDYSGKDSGKDHETSVPEPARADVCMKFQLFDGIGVKAEIYLDNVTAV